MDGNELVPVVEDDALGGRVIVVETSSTMLSEDDKAQEIRECLQLQEGSGNVDLWELRQLTLSPGGLLQPSLRRLAWPLLMGFSPNDVLQRPSEDDGAPVDDVNGVDVSTTLIWNVEDLVRRSREGKESFWFAASTRVQPSLDAPLLVPSPCNSDRSLEETTVDESMESRPVAAAPTSTGPSEKDKVLIAQVLSKALMELHRDDDDDDVQKDASELANLAALLLINLDLSSKAMASQLLSRMCTYPLMTTAALSGASSSSLEQLLSILVDKLQLQDVVATNAKQAATWFSGVPQVVSAPMASRLMDAFLVSHPLFPVYFAAAISEGEAWTMENVEAWIGLGLEYMQQLPPAALVEAAADSSYVVPAAPAWALAASLSVNWAPPQPEPTALPSSSGEQQMPFSDDDDSDDDSETDGNWELLSTASAGEEEVEEEQDDAMVPPAMDAVFYESYPLAAVAAGLINKVSARSLPDEGDNVVKSKSNGKRGIVGFLLVAFVLVGVAVTVAWSHGLVGQTGMPAGQAAPAMADPSPRPAARPQQRRRKKRNQTKARFPMAMKPTQTKVPVAMARPSRIPVSTAQPSVVLPHPPTLAPVPSPPPKPAVRLVPSSPKAKLSVMIRESETRQSNDATTAPEEEQMLQKYILDGLVQSLKLEPVVEFCFDCWREGVLSSKPSSAVAAPAPKTKGGPLKGLVRKVGKALDRVRRAMKHVHTVMTLGLLSVLHLIVPQAKQAGGSN